MHHLLHLACTSFLAAAAAAQTVGVTGVNDYWITPGGAPNATSCAALTVNTPAVLSLNASAAPGTTFIVFLSACGCAPCNPVPALATSSCLPGPSTACPSSNQFLEALLFAGCAWFVVPGLTNAAGSGSITFPVPAISPPIVVGTQAAFLGPAACVVAPFNVLMSPGWNLTLQ
jgi:hypothetical protein